MRTRFLLAVLPALLAGYAAPVYALSPAPPPLPPLGWEERLSPGFEPPIEEVVVHMSRSPGRQGEDALREVWGHWDTGAVEVLLRMLEDEGWERFRWQIIPLLVASPHAEARNWAAHTLRAHGVYPALDSEAPAWLDHLLAAYTRKYPEEAAALQELFLERGTPRMRLWGIQGLIVEQSEASLARAEELAHRLEDQVDRVGTLQILEGARGRLRAQQPMSVRAPADQEPTGEPSGE